MSAITETAVAATYQDLRTLAEMFEDAQGHRLAAENRVRSLTVGGARYDEIVKETLHAEKHLSRLLRLEYRRIAPPGVVAWQEATPGLGDHTVARLLGHLGHPRYAVPKFWADNMDVADDEFGTAENPKKALQEGEPFERTVSQLWQYCGHGAPVRRQKGITQAQALSLGNPRCKMLVHLLVAGIVKTQTPLLRAGDDLGRCGYLAFLHAEKEKYAARTHTGPCSGGYVSAGPGKVVFAKCKVDGRYAAEGDPFSPGHINSIGERHLGKQLLRDMWIVSGANEMGDIQ